MPIEIDASVPVDNLQGGSRVGRRLLERGGLRRAVTPTVTNMINFHPDNVVPLNQKVKIGSSSHLHESAHQR